MTFRFSNYDRLYLARRIALLVERKVFSVQDGCFVVPVRCASCRQEFFEEFDHALAMAVGGPPKVCIRCEGPSADVPSVSWCWQAFYAR